VPCDYWPELSQHDENQMFMRVVNRWVQLEIAMVVHPHAKVCEAWRVAAATLLQPSVEQCALGCKGLVTLKQTVSMAQAACFLGPGQVSITPVQYPAVSYTLQTAEPNPEWTGTVSLVTKQQNLFSDNDWRAPDAAARTCEVCTGGDCLRGSALDLSTGTDPFANADIPSTQEALVFGTTEFLDQFTDSEIKRRWKLWNSDDPLPNRIARASSKTTCAEGLTPACLQNRAAITGRACSFQGVCFTRREVFGEDFVPFVDTDFVVRGRPDSHLEWFSDEACSAFAGAHLKHVYAFSSVRLSFKLSLPLVCGSCPDSQGVGNFDADSGAMHCEECESPYFLEVALGTHTGCSETVVFNKRFECPLHAVSLRARPQDRLRCAACRTLNAADGFARGSHRPYMTEDCETCVEKQGELARAAGRDVSAEIREILHPCGRCHDCRNCSAASTFDGLHASFCRPLDSMAVLASAEWAGSAAAPAGRLGGRDQFKRDEYTPAAVDADHFRDARFQQQECTCNNRHKYAQFCGGYALRDQDAWMTPDADQEGLERQLSLFKTGDDEMDDVVLARHSIKRGGVCRPCLACPDAHFNGLCRQGRAGACALCRSLASCTATRNPYLHHNHALGCAQTLALTDYECRKCPVWAKISAAYMLLVGCGDQDLCRWTPTATAFDGVLDVDECRFDAAVDDGASAICQHAGAVLQRQRPFGNFSTLMLYCPPGWFFRCADRATTDPFDPECCAKCEVCPPEQSINTTAWRACSGATDYDTQPAHCVDRCENNMFERNNTCLYCTTCKEGEL